MGIREWRLNVCSSYRLRALRDRFEPRILEIRAAHEPAAAMEMEVDALGCGGSDDPKRDRTARPGDFDDTRAWRMIDREIDSPALRPRLPDRLGRFGLPWRDLR